MQVLLCALAIPQDKATKDSCATKHVTPHVQQTGRVLVIAWFVNSAYSTALRPSVIHSFRFLPWMSTFIYQQGPWTANWSTPWACKVRSTCWLCYRDGSICLHSRLVSLLLPMIFHSGARFSTHCWWHPVQVMCYAVAPHICFLPASYPCFFSYLSSADIPTSRERTAFGQRSLRKVGELELFPTVSKRE